MGLTKGKYKVGPHWAGKMNETLATCMQDSNRLSGKANSEDYIWQYFSHKAQKQMEQLFRHTYIWDKTIVKKQGSDKHEVQDSVTSGCEGGKGKELGGTNIWV